MEKHNSQTNSGRIEFIQSDFCSATFSLVGSITNQGSQSIDTPSGLPATKSTTENNIGKGSANVQEESSHKTVPISISPGRPKAKSCPPQNQHFDTSAVSDLLRLFVKKGEYVYARPCDIVMLESCDHLVKVYLLYGDKVKKAVRNNTLKDFLFQLPGKQFVRIGRFCAINVDRLSGGNYNDQTFEFDFRVSIKLKHTIPYTVFNAIGK